MGNNNLSKTVSPISSSDWGFLGILLLLFLPFFVSQSLYDLYNLLNAQHGMLMSFVKFAILATMGEALGLRIRKGVYSYDGFGLLPRALVWGLLGIGIKVAFIVFKEGAGAFLGYLSVEPGADFGFKVLAAFTASALMNVIFAPVMMVTHKITDTHIVATGGTIRGFFRPINVSASLSAIDWNSMWGFVLKKTIPFFWIPAHTITFLLPANFQVLFAALLGVALGVILAFAANKK